MIFRWLAAAALSAGIVVSAAACGHHSGSTPYGSSTGSLIHGSPLASVPGADKAAANAVIKQCLPVTASSADQLKWATAMVNDTKAHPNGARARVVSCAGIPQAKRPAAEAALLTDVEHVRWDKKAARQQFWDVTLPAWVMKWRSA